MQQESRVKKSFLNARVNLIFYFLTLALSFFSRGIFLDNLGADFIGLTGTLGSLIGFLNLAESGVSSAIAVVLYAPIFNGNRTEINEIVSVLGFLYHKIGLLILTGGVLLSCFFPLIFSDAVISQSIIYLVFYSFLGSALIGYFINYKQVLLSADQRNYVVAAYSQTANLLKIGIQIAIAYYLMSWVLWILIEFTFGIIYSIILNWKIRQVYPWLTSNAQSGKTLLKKYPQIIRNTKQLFIHKIGAVVYGQTTPLLVYLFASLETVAYYGNYTTVTFKLGTLLNNFLGGTDASVGNLIAEGDKSRIMKVYWELTSIRFIFVAVAVFAMYNLLPPFIALWLGRQYIMSHTVLILVLIAFSLSIIRGVTEEFLFGYGLFRDIWSPLAEAAILIAVGAIGGYFGGFEGALFGPIISSILIIYIWKPYYLFRDGFKLSIWKYWGEYIKYLLSISLSFYFAIKLIDILPFDADIFTNWFDWIFYATLILVIYSPICCIFLYLSNNGSRTLFHRLIRR